jgi:hypothetical protein
MRIHPLSITSFLLAAGIAVTGCSGGDSDTTPPAGQVEVPEIKGAVALENFCDLYSQIECAGSVGCCSGDLKIYSSADACLAATTTCKDALKPVLDSALVADGTVVYDPDAAGDYLRAWATSTSVCGASNALPPGVPFLTGTRAEGADCKTAANDAGGLYSCKPGLECKLTSDETTGETSATCAPASGKALPGEYGDACASDEECRNGPCQAGKCDVDPALYCEAAPVKSPPSNAVPATLSLNSADADNANTSGDITLKYRTGGDVNGADVYSCTLSGGIGRDKTKTCTPTKTGTAAAGQESLYVGTDSNDGLLVDSVCALDSSGNAIECAGTFLTPRLEYCTKCSGLSCGRCWVDGNDHGSCATIKILVNDLNQLVCQ